MATKISQQTTDKLLKATDKISTYVEGGVSPNDAATKVARELGLTGPQIDLVCKGYNAGAVTAQRKSGTDFEDKFASIPLIDPAVVRENVFPSTVKTASIAVVSDIYNKPFNSGRLQKVASTYTPEQIKSTSVLKKLAACDCGCGGYGKCDGNPEKVAEAKRQAKKDKVASIRKIRRELDTAKMAVYTKLGGLTEHIRLNFREHQLVPSVAYFSKYAIEQDPDLGVIIATHLADELLDTVQHSKFLKTAADTLVQPEPLSSKTHNLINDLIKTSSDWAARESSFLFDVLKLRAEIEDIEGFAPKTAALLPPDVNSYSELRDEAFAKMAGIFDVGLGAIFGSSFGKDNPGLTPDKVRENVLKLNDPAHNAKIRAIKIQAMLNELAQSDDVIGSYSPHELATSFNELSRTTPGLLNNMAVLRANLRRQLQGNISPFEAKELLATEKIQRQRDLPVDIGDM